MIILALFFLTLHKNIHCRYSLEAPWHGMSNECPQYMFYGELEKIITEISSNTPAEQILCKCSFETLKLLK